MSSYFSGYVCQDCGSTEKQHDCLEQLAIIAPELLKPKREKAKRV